MNRHIPRKRFGQHFLHDERTIGRILLALAPRPEQTIVEIGPGLGALTVPLLERIGHLDVVELDRDVIPHLQEHCAGKGDLRIHAADALNFDYASLTTPGKKLRLIGNLPYNISTPLLFALLAQRHCISDMLFMLQKEVAQRICAEPGGGDFGRLSVMTQYFCVTELVLIVKPGAFTPPPKVDSAVIRLTPHNVPPHRAHDETYFAQLVGQAFSQRRKTLRNSLRDMVNEQQFAATGIDPGLRPETLSVAQFVALANASGDVTKQITRERQA